MGWADRSHRTGTRGEIWVGRRIRVIYAIQMAGPEHIKTFAVGRHDVLYIGVTTLSSQSCAHLGEIEGCRIGGLEGTDRMKLDLPDGSNDWRSGCWVEKCLCALARPDRKFCCFCSFQLKAIETPATRARVPGRTVAATRHAALCLPTCDRLMAASRN